MGSSIRFILPVILLALATFAKTAWTEPGGGDRYLVKLREPSRHALGLLEASGLRVRRCFGEISVCVAEPMDPARFDAAAAEELGRRPEFAYAEKAHRFHILLAPNDDMYSQQAEMQRMDVEKAWNTSVGSYDVLVAVSDTGVDLTHPDLRHQIWTNPGEIPGNGIDDDHNGYVDDVHGWDFADHTNDPSDPHRHGSHVAGIIGAEGNNGSGISGVNWKVRLMPLRFMDRNGIGFEDYAIETILYAAKNGARLVNVSWGGESVTQALKDAIQFAYAHGTLVIAAAGNDLADTDKRPNYPSSLDLPGIVSVAASVSPGKLAVFSNYGAGSVHLAAPGQNVLSTFPGGRYGRLSGTSMAAPMATGVAALILSVHPELSVTELRNALLNAVVPAENYAGRLATGGDLSAARALEQFNDGFAVWPGSISVRPGSSFQFTTHGGRGGISWEVSDRNLARIDADGTLHALRSGVIQVSARERGGRTASTGSVRLLGATAETDSLPREP